MMIRENTQTAQITLNDHQNQPLQIQTISCPIHTRPPPLQTPQHQNNIQTEYCRYGPVFWYLSHIRKNFIYDHADESYGDFIYINTSVLCMRAAKALAMAWMHRLV